MVGWFYVMTTLVGLLMPKSTILFASKYMVSSNYYYYYSSSLVNNYSLKQLFIIQIISGVIQFEGWLVGFYGISTFLGYLMLNPVYT